MGDAVVLKQTVIAWNTEEHKPYLTTPHAMVSNNYNVGQCIALLPIMFQVSHVTEGSGLEYG